jgi:hypothetical protein
VPVVGLGSLSEDGSLMRMVRNSLPRARRYAAQFSRLDFLHRPRGLRLTHYLPGPRELKVAEINLK